MRATANDSPIDEGWFKAKSKSKGKSKGGKNLLHRTRKPQNFSGKQGRRRGILPRRDDRCHVTWSGFSTVLPQQQPYTRFSLGKKMILVLDKASYRHGCDAEVSIESAQKPSRRMSLIVNSLSRSYTARSIEVERQNETGDTLTHRFEIPQERDSSFPNANQEDGVSIARVALETRSFFQPRHPERRWKPLCGVKGVGVDLDAAMHMPSFQPIEPFWAHGKRYVSVNC